MLTSQTRLSDLTIDELLMLIRRAIREELHAQPRLTSHEQAALLDLEPLSVGSWPEGLKLLSREEFYDDER
jgi:hypothetical protein